MKERFRYLFPEKFRIIPEILVMPIFYTCISVLFILLIMYLKDFIKLPSLSSIFIMPFGKISLSEAAQIAYKKLKGTMHATASEVVYSDNPPQYFVNELVEKGTIWGRNPTSKIFQIVSKSGRIKDTGKRMTLDDIVYVDLQIEKNHLRNYIKEAKKTKFAA